MTWCWQDDCTDEMLWDRVLADDSAWVTHRRNVFLDETQIGTIAWDLCCDDGMAYQAKSYAHTPPTKTWWPTYDEAKQWLVEQAYTTLTVDVR